MTAGEIITVLRAFEEDSEVEVCDPFNIYHEILKIELQHNPNDEKLHLVFITGGI